MSNRNGIIAFLLITFGITYLAEAILILSGFRVTSVPAAIGLYVILGVMWVPTVAALITTRFNTYEKTSSLHLRFGPSWKPYLATALLIPLAFILTYLLTWLLGISKPDWQLVSFFRLFVGTGVDMSAAPSPSLMLTALYFTLLVPGPFFNSIFGFKYPDSPILGILFMMLFTTAVGFCINEMTLHYKSTILAGWIHGVFNAQAYGIFPALLFPTFNPFLDGNTGIVGLVALTLLGFGTMQWFKRFGPGQPFGSEEELSEEQAVEIFATWNLLNH